MGNPSLNGVKVKMRRVIFGSVGGLVLIAALSAGPVWAVNADVGEKPIWLAVTRPVFQKAIKPLAEMRSKEGFETVVSTLPIAEAIAALKRKPQFLVLVGDDEPGKEKEHWYIQSRRQTLYRWREKQERKFASDTLWGDFDGDLVPDIPVGRFPVRTADQLKLIIKKIIAFERREPRMDDLRLPIWAGSSGYNQMFNMMATELLLNTVRMNASEWLKLWIISADPMHSLCGWPFDQPEMFTKQLKRGGVMAVLMGHGTSNYFYAMNFENNGIGYVAAHFENALATGEPAPATVIIACGTGNFTGQENCLTESRLLKPGGPVAAIGATTESHPLTNYFSGLCLVRQRGEKSKRIGSVWLAAQRQMMIARDFIIERMLCDVEGKLEDKINVTKLRRDQILMYALMGDPATRLKLPDKLNGKIKRLDDGWQWQVDKPKNATRLYVSFRPAGQTFPTTELPLKKVAARKRFEEANATFAFNRMSELGEDKTWKGTLKREGTLRLVAFGPGQMYVKVFELKSAEQELVK